MAQFNVRNYPYTHCREQHYWKLYDGSIDNAAKVGCRVDVCTACGMKRYRWMSLKTGQLVRNTRYSAPKDYYVIGGLTREDRGQMRVYNFLSDLQARAPKAINKKPPGSH